METTSAKCSLSRSEKSVYDSIQYYRQQLGQLQRSIDLSFRNDARTKALLGNITRLESQTEDYGGASIYFQFASGNFDILNADNGVIGFKAMTEPMLGLGMGFTFRRNRRMLDINIGAIGINQKTKKGNETIQTSFTTALQVEWGYDLIRRKAIAIFPYAGLGLRTTDFEYKAPKQINASPSSITGIVVNNPSVSDAIIEFGYQAGIGFEFKIPTKDYEPGVPIFLKAGTNRPFKRKTLNFEGVRYDPRLNYGDWMITIGFKFAGR